MQYRMLLIPANTRIEMSIVTHRDDDLTSLVHEPGHSSTELDFKTFRAHGVQFCYDDLGLFRIPLQRNIRAELIWAALAGVDSSDFAQPLAGNFVMLGLDPHSGDTRHVPMLAAAMAMKLWDDEYFL